MVCYTHTLPTTLILFSFFLPFEARTSSQRWDARMINPSMGTNHQSKDIFYHRCWKPKVSYSVAEQSIFYEPWRCRNWQEFVWELNTKCLARQMFIKDAQQFDFENENSRMKIKVSSDAESGHWHTQDGQPFSHRRSRTREICSIRCIYISNCHSQNRLTGSGDVAHLLWKTMKSR